ncbi:MAG TPA: peptidylprolyl isomerase [Planctomycetaceae bacterium]|nr:peptidylprolyl isomerase [Planctomycetaceae bacterium]
MRILVAALLLVFGAGLVNAQETARSTKAPDKFRVKFETSCGDFTVEVQRDWAPLGADRFHELVQAGFYDECRFFRVVPGFVVQWGMNGDPAVYAKWKDREIKDDKVTQSNREGMITFASRGPNTRTCQLFINLADNERLDDLGFAPFGKVVEGLDAVKKITSEYGQRPQQPLIQEEGNAYLKKEFPKMDYIKKATVVPAG